ncbi:MAG: bifunctional protein PyrR [Bacteroidia bacterium]|nr:MAG: bifunctional protein PyrR [Bacteroidia bacterium]
MERVVAEGDRVGLTLRRMAWQMAEQGESFLLVGIEPRGSLLARWLHPLFETILETSVGMGTLDVTLWRDDLHYRRKLHIPRPAHLPFPVEGQRIWLVDDVLYTGRTVRAALDALREWGRPAWVKLAVLVERRGLREFPIMPDCVGFVLDTAPQERVQVVLEPKPIIRLQASYE